MPDSAREFSPWTGRQAEWAALDTARAHIDSAKLLYAARQWPQACFLGMAAIELVGKALLFQRVWAAYEDREADRERYELAEADLRARGHRTKAVQAAVAALIFNDDARARHGQNVHTGLWRIEAVRYIAEVENEWMTLRNACLYVDLDTDLRCPLVSVTREHSYLMIVGALEVLAKALSPFFTYRNEGSPIDGSSRPDDAKSRAVLVELETFCTAERTHVDLDRLPEIGCPERVAQLQRSVTSQRADSS